VAKPPPPGAEDEKRRGVEHPEGEGDRSGAFGNVEDGYAGACDLAYVDEYVAGANIAHAGVTGAKLTDIFAGHQSRDQVGRGDRSDEIGEDDGDDTGH